MTDNQKNFCKDFISLMRKYNIQRMRAGEGYVSFRKDGQEVCLYDYDKIMGLHIFFPATSILFEEDEEEVLGNVE